MIVVDLETSGVDPDKHSIVSIAATDFSDTTKEFYEECRIWEGAHVMEEALAINGFSLGEVTDPHKKTEEEIITAFFAWALVRENHTIAGENPSFDRDFLKKAAGRYGLNWPLATRTIDLHTISYYHHLRRGIPVPLDNNRSDLNTSKTLIYVGLPPQALPHNALTDVRMETEAFYRLIYDKPHYEEFMQYPIPWIDQL